MPITDDGYTPYTKEQIKDRLTSSFESKFSTTVQPGDLIERQLEAEAEVLAEYQEQALESVYNSAYLSTATGNELDKLVERIGLSRQEAVPATGTVDFISSNIPSNQYTIPSGTVVQTGGSDPIQFETTNTTSIQHIDGFNDGANSEWSGDSSNFPVVTRNGENVLEIPATADTSIYRQSPTLTIGTALNTDWELKSGVTKALRLRGDGSNYYEITLDQNGNNFSISIVDDGSVTTSDETNVSIPTGEVHLEVRFDVTGELTAVLYETSSRDTELVRGSLTDDEIRHREFDVGIASLDGTDTSYVSNIATTRTTANIAGQEGGVQTNVAPNTIRVMPSPPAGVNTITNPLATGDSSLQNVNGTSFVLGKEREDDEQLRDRAFDSSSIGGSGTVDAIGSAIRSLDSVNSVRMFQNKEDVDNTDSGGLPPNSFEAAVHGGIDQDIARAIFDTKSIDSHDYGGAHGTEKTHTITSDVLAEDETISWSEVPEVTLHITIDAIVDSTYVGDEEIQSRIVEYIGGTDVDGAIVGGADVGEDIYTSVVKDQIVDPDETGVWEVDSITIDGDGDGTDDTTTLANGADVFAVANSEIAVTNGRDGSITINTASK